MGKNGSVENLPKLLKSNGVTKIKQMQRETSIHTDTASVRSGRSSSYPAQGLATSIPHSHPIWRPFRVAVLHIVFTL